MKGREMEEGGEGEWTNEWEEDGMEELKAEIDEWRIGEMDKWTNEYMEEGRIG